MSRFSIVNEYPSLNRGLLIHHYNKKNNINLKMNSLSKLTLLIMKVYNFIEYYALL